MKFRKKRSGLWSVGSREKTANLIHIWMINEMQLRGNRIGEKTIRVDQTELGELSTKAPHFCCYHSASTEQKQIKGTASGRDIRRC